MASANMLNVVIDAVNDAIQVAIEHGGDSGGPYYSNLEKQKETVENLAFLFGPAPVSVICVGDKGDKWYELCVKESD